MITLSIPDMSCGHCKSAVERALAEVTGAGSIGVDLVARAVTVSGTPDLAPLLAALDSAGYPATVTSDHG